MNDDPTQPSDPKETAQESAQAPRATPALSLRFEIAEEIGQGGMGAVYRSHDQNLRRDVAVKVLKSNLNQSDARVVDKFMFEAEILGQLEHPGVIPVYERGALPGGQGPFYAMKLVRGETFESMMNALRPGDLRTPATISRLVETFRSACQTVAHAHGCGIVHHDLKPANIMIDEHGSVLVLDWGLAFKNDDLEQRPKPGTVAGTPAYMAPEQISGDTNNIGPHTDVFSLGCVLYELLTARRPFRGATQSELKRAILESKPLAIRKQNPAVPRSLQAICEKALATQPADRYADAAELTHDLENWRDDLPISAYQPTALERLQSWSRRKPRSASAIVTAAAMILLALTVSLTSWISEWRYEQRLIAELAGGIRLIHDAQAYGESLPPDSVEAAESEVVGQIHLDNLRVLYGTYIGRRGESPAESLNTLTDEIGPAVQTMIIENIERHFDNGRYLYVHFLAWNAEDQIALNWSAASLDRMRQLADASAMKLSEQWGSNYTPPDWEVVTSR